MEWTRNRKLITYFVLAYGFSWLVMGPLALQARGVINLNVPLGLHYLAAYGPTLAAVVTALISEGADGLKTLWGRATKWRVSIGWWGMAISPLLIYGLVLAISAAVGAPTPGPVRLGEINFLPPIGAFALIFWVLTYGLGEEIGWRGYALPLLEEVGGAFRSTLILWLLWASWHLPAFFYLYEAAIIPGWLIGLLAGTIIFTWLMNSTGSALIVGVWHGLFDALTACAACGMGLLAPVLTTLVMIFAVVTVIWFTPTALNWEARRRRGGEA